MVRLWMRVSTPSTTCRTAGPGPCLPSVARMALLLDSALADARAQVWAAQVAVVRAGAVTWTGTAAEAAEVRRTDLLAGLRRCLDALDDLDRLALAVRRAEQQCAAAAPLVAAGYSPGAAVWP